MNEKKIIFFDIDGTIWDWDGNIPVSAVKAVKALIENGHIPVICSGRSRAHIMDERLFDMGFKDVVAACGNYVEADGRVIYERHLSEDTIKKIISLSKSCKVPIVLEGQKKHWVSEKGFERDGFVDRMYQNMGDAAVKGLVYSAGMLINKASGDILNCSDYKTFKSGLTEEFDFIEHGLALNVDQNPGLEDNAITAVFEFVPKGSDKGFGIRKYCEYRNVDPKDTIAIGDSINDVEMLEAVGYSIAMGNGTDSVKKLVDYVTSDINEDGLFNAMKHLKLI